MDTLTFWKVITVDESALLERVLRRLDETGVRYCVIGGQAVNAYADPLVSLDLDLAVAAEEVDRLESVFADGFTVERFAHSLNVSSPGSALRVQFQLDPRYAAFVDRARPGSVLGLRLPVAAAADVLDGKVWAAQDATRRPSKRQKDLADIARLVESLPELRERVPDALWARLEG